MYLQQFTITDAAGRKSKGGITIGDAIHNIFVIGFLGLFGSLVYMLSLGHYAKRQIKKYDTLIKLYDAEKNDATARQDIINKRMTKEYGKSWVTLFYTELSKHIKVMLESLLKSQYDLSKGTISAEQANSNFRDVIVNYGKSTSFLLLSSDFWRYRFQKSGFTWLTNFWNGYDKKKDGKVAMYSESKEGDEACGEYIYKLTHISYRDSAICNIGLVWMYDNHAIVIGEVLQDILNKHPEYAEICPI